jgi:hypothetical protein
MNDLRKILVNIVNKEPWTIRAYIAQIALKQKSVKMFFRKLEYNLFTFEMIESVFEVDNLHQFFVQHWFEILTVMVWLDNNRFNWKEVINTHVLFAFEIIAKKMASNDLGLDI